MKTENNIVIKASELKIFIKNILLKIGVRNDVAAYVSEGLVQTSLRGVDSHGVRLLPHYVSGVEGGRINPNPKYKIRRTSPSTAMFDGDHTFGHAAGMEATNKAVEIAKESGTANIAVYNSTHFGAAAYYALEIAKHNMIGMSFTNTDALIKTYGGKKPFLGNNPICFTAPCTGEEPLCLDMATSIVTFNKIRQWRDEGISAPEGVGADVEGNEIKDPNKIKTLLPVGGYKGYGLSLMVEILCSLLTGMPYGPHIPKMFEAPLSEKRYLGHFITAIRIDCFQEINVFKKRISVMIDELRNEPRYDENVPIKVAGDPEKTTAVIRKETGIPLARNDWEIFEKMSEKYKIGIGK